MLLRTGGTVAAENRIDFRKALAIATSNLATDPTSAGFRGRLSRWLPYDYTPAGGAYADRVGLSQSYNPISGIAYRVSLTDPDNTPTTRPPLRIVESRDMDTRREKKRYLMVTPNG